MGLRKAGDSRERIQGRWASERGRTPCFPTRGARLRGPPAHLPKRKACQAHGPGRMPIRETASVRVVLENWAWNKRKQVQVLALGLRVQWEGCAPPHTHRVTKGATITDDTGRPRGHGGLDAGLVITVPLSSGLAALSLPSVPPGACEARGSALLSPRDNDCLTGRAESWGSALWVIPSQGTFRAMP